MKFTDEQVQEMLKGDEEARRNLAEHGYELFTLMQDDSWVVRREVARQGYGLYVLIHDGDWYVKDIAEKLIHASRYLVESNFGTYNGNLVLFTWDNRYLIVSGCYETDNLDEWESLCSSRLGKETAAKYANIIQGILKEEVK